MECDVVHEKLLRVFQRRKHVGDLFRHRRQLLPGGSFCSESGGADFQHRSTFKHVLVTETVKLCEQAQGFTVESWRTIADESACALSRLEHAHRDQGAQARAQSGTADAKLF